MPNNSRYSLNATHRLHEGGGGSVGGTGQEKARPLGEPVFSTSRFVPLAETLGHVLLPGCAGPGCRITGRAPRCLAFSVATENAAVL